MFELGKRYEIRMIIGGEETTMWPTIEKYEHPLVKFADVPPDDLLNSEVIYGETVNVTSPNFISAKLLPAKENPFDKL